MAEYIDRGTFKESVEERYCKPCKAEGKDHNGCWCRACGVDDMIDEVDCFQPADVAPVVHGRWIEDHDYLKCAECGVMERLTRRSDTGHAYYPHCFEEPCGGDGCKIKDCLFDNTICERLAKYEETGLEPEEVISMQAAKVALEASDAPAADAAPVVRGRWKYYHKRNKAVCTCCSFERDLDENFGAAISCPNCGAKMDGGDGDAAD